MNLEQKLEEKKESSEPTPAERSLFRYNDGFNDVYGDPLEIASTLDTDPEYSPNKHIPLLEAGGRPGGEAWKVLTRAVRRAFKLPSFDHTTGEGLTDQEALELFWEFSTYISGLKKNIDPSVMPPESTDATSQPSTETIMKDSSGWSSTSTGKGGETSTGPSTGQFTQ